MYDEITLVTTRDVTIVIVLLIVHITNANIKFVTSSDEDKLRTNDMKTVERKLKKNRNKNSCINGKKKCR